MGGLPTAIPGTVITIQVMPDQGEVAVDLDEWTLGWTVKSGQKISRRLRSVVNRSHCPLSAHAYFETHL